MEMWDRNKYIMTICKLSNVDGLAKAAKERVNKRILFQDCLLTNLRMKWVLLQRVAQALLVSRKDLCCCWHLETRLPRLLQSSFQS